MIKKDIIYYDEKKMSKDLLIEDLKIKLKKIEFTKDDETFFILVNEIYQSLELIECDEDPIIFGMLGGYNNDFVSSFLILYFGTNDIIKSLEGYSLYKSLTTYVVLLDKHYDEKNYEYKIRADKIFKSIMQKVDGYPKHAIIHMISSLWTIASYEIYLKERMLKGEKISSKEIKNHILKKSSDTLLYSVIFDYYIPEYNPNILQISHYNQGILDIQDDLNDLEEDIFRSDLNAFVLAASHNVNYDNIFRNKTTSKEIVQKASLMINDIIDDFENFANGIIIPSKFDFMKIFTKNYLQTLRESIKNY